MERYRVQNSLHIMNGMNPKQRCVVILGCTSMVFFEPIEADP
jgi:hypothetical protein